MRSKLHFEPAQNTPQQLRRNREVNKTKSRRRQTTNTATRTNNRPQEQTNGHMNKQHCHMNKQATTRTNKIATRTNIIATRTNNIVTRTNSISTRTNNISTRTDNVFTRTQTTLSPEQTTFPQEQTAFPQEQTTFPQEQATFSGKKVICYFSAGSYENWRSDHSAFPSDVIGHKLDGWNEKWLDIRDGRVKSIMSARLKKAQDKGCDGVEPDNVDGYTNDNGFHLTAHDQLTYNKWLATEAHNHGLSVGLKNDVDQIQELESHFDWALNEECVHYNECKKYQPFIDAHKAVFHVEYVDSHSSGSSKKGSVCHSSRRPQQFITLIKDWDLTDWRMTC
ncbi:unnamed protein product [Mytilus coruscus]|uniref:Glycoside-hydrolase family GH114 TIM-barrel domain-containing protein n=1 Tax=Mytilus coruscus TaxID=42192 RepID=A0A6J8C1I2_MYTCO|nr:unnamed protein product [Mytilus coruscus]